MSNNQFDRVVINPRERPLSSDINQAQSQIERTLRELFDRFFLKRISESNDSSGLPISGFIGDSFKLRPTSPVSMNLSLASGMGFFYDPTIAPSIGGVVGVDDLSRWKPLVLLSNLTLTVPPPPGSGNSRIDILEIIPNRRLTDSASRDVLNPVSGVFDPTLVQKSLAWDLDPSVGYVVHPAVSTTAIGYKSGVPAVSPTAPPTTTGYIKIAEILVGPTVVTIDGNVIKDLRSLLFPYNCVPFGMSFTVSTSVLSVPTINSMLLPPGMTLAVRHVTSISGSHTDFELYLLAGNIPSTQLPTIHIQPIDTAVVKVLRDMIQCSMSWELVTSITQAQIQGANTRPTIKVAVGQPMIRMFVEGANDTGSGTVKHAISGIMVGG